MSFIIDMCALFKCVLFRYPETPPQYQVRRFFLIIIFLSGVGYLIVFFNAGNLAMVAYDWVKEDAYLNTLRDAQINWVVPWLWSEPFYHGTQRFLANPEIILTPDIVLLRGMSNSVFVIVHVVLLYSVGFWGCLLIARRLSVSLIAFLIFWLVFNFNGYLTAHLAVGHLQWAGYYFLPLFFVFLSCFVTDSRMFPYKATRSAVGMGLLLGMLFLNGSFHIAIWCSMLMSITVLWSRAICLNVASAVVVGSLIGFGRLLPAGLWFPGKESFISGYPSFGTLIDAITSIREHNFRNSGGVFGVLGWWEYDIYIGFTAFVILMVGFVVAMKRKALHQEPIFAAAGVMLLLSFGDVFALIANSYLPFTGVERVSSRFIIIPFTLFLITAVQGVDELLRSWSETGKIAILMGVPFIVFELVLHLDFWRVSHLERAFPETTKPLLSLVPNFDHIYAFSVYAGWFVSLISLLWVVAFLFRNRKASKQASFQQGTASGHHSATHHCGR